RSAGSAIWAGHSCGGGILLAALSMDRGSRPAHSRRLRADRGGDGVASLPFRAPFVGARALRHRRVVRGTARAPLAGHVHRLGRGSAVMSSAVVAHSPYGRREACAVVSDAASAHRPHELSHPFVLRLWNAAGRVCPQAGAVRFTNAISWTAQVVPVFPAR